MKALNQDLDELMTAAIDGRKRLNSASSQANVHARTIERAARSISRIRSERVADPSVEDSYVRVIEESRAGLRRSIADTRRALDELKALL